MTAHARYIQLFWTTLTAVYVGCKTRMHICSAHLLLLLHCLQCPCQCIASALVTMADGRITLHFVQAAVADAVAQARTEWVSAL